MKDLENHQLIHRYYCLDASLAVSRVEVGVADTAAASFADTVTTPVGFLPVTTAAAAAAAAVAGAPCSLAACRVRGHRCRRYLLDLAERRFGVDMAG